MCSFKLSLYLFWQTQTPGVGARPAGFQASRHRRPRFPSTAPFDLAQDKLRTGARIKGALALLALQQPATSISEIRTNGGDQTKPEVVVRVVRVVPAALNTAGIDWIDDPRPATQHTVALGL
jgi:hypothetical protein